MISENEEGAKKVSFVTSKSRIAPVGGQTIPRLELLGALILSRLVVKVQEALRDFVDLSEVICMTDSTVALWWIKNTSSTYKQFVQERVREVRSNVGPDCWRHIEGKQNPADQPSRGCYSNEFDSSTFIKGPKWLCQGEEFWPIKKLEKTSVADSELKKEAKKAINLNVAKIEDKGIDKIIDASKFSSFDKLLRITSWVFRFVQNCRTKEGERVMGEILATEILASETLWVKNLQLSLKNSENFKKTSLSLGLFLDKDGLWRCGGRVGNSTLPYDTKHPMILPPDHYVTKLIIWKAHMKVFHNGVKETLIQLRSKFWIVKGRQIVKKHLNKCNTCRKLEGLSYGSPSISQLPKSRVEGGQAFQGVGIDFCGPLYLANPKGETKSYIALITCTSSRMVHLEHFIGCLKRFFARRGTPSLIISDNAKTFKSEAIKKFTATRGITWHFNLAKAPWWGGSFRAFNTQHKEMLEEDFKAF